MTHLPHCNASCSYECDEPEVFGRATPLPISSCTGLGLSCREHRCSRGELLPRRFTLTRFRGRFLFCDTAVRVYYPSLTCVRNPALRCPDFPLRINGANALTVNNTIRHNKMNPGNDFSQKKMLKSHKSFFLQNDIIKWHNDVVPRRGSDYVERIQSP